MRRFMSGAIWGAIVGVLGLGVVSQMAPIGGKQPAVVASAPVAPVISAGDSTLMQGAAQTSSAPSTVAGTSVPAATATSQPAPDAPVVDTAVPAQPAPDAPGMAAGTPPEGAMSAPAVPEDEAPVAPAVSGTTALPSLVPDAAPAAVPPPSQPPIAPPSDAPAAQTQPDVADAPAAPAMDAPAELALADAASPAFPDADTAPAMAELPPPPPLTAEEQALLDAAMAGAAPLAPVENPIVDAPVADAAPTRPADPDNTDTLTQTAPTAPVVRPPTLTPTPGLKPVGVMTDATPSTLVPTPPLGTEGAVIQRQLPQIPPPATAAEAAPAAKTLAPDAPPLARFAASFENADAKPLFSIVLIDDGAADVDRETLSALPFAVSFVLDPLMPGAADAAALYRAGGKEVIMLATGIPAGATPADLEQTFQAHAAALPEAVAVIDLAEAGFQNDRALATQLVPILAAQGRGLLTWDRGLNAADQVARREALPTAMIFRALDSEGEDSPLIRRYLDRAAFKAAQDGAVTVVGHTRPGTIAALLEWAVEGRAATVALAPVSAVLNGP